MARVHTKLLNTKQGDLEPQEWRRCLDFVAFARTQVDLALNVRASGCELQLVTKPLPSFHKSPYGIAALLILCPAYLAGSGVLQLLHRFSSFSV